MIDGRSTTLTGLSDFVANLEASGYFKRSIDIVSSTTETMPQPPGELIKFSDQGACSSGRGRKPASAAAAARRRPHRGRRKADGISLTKLPWYAQVGAFVVLARRRRRRVLLLLRDAGARRHGGARDAARRCRPTSPRGRRRRRSCRSSGRRSTISRRGSTTCRRCCRKRRMPPICCAGCRPSPTQSNLTIKSFKPAPVVTQAAARRVADRARARRHVSQPGDLLRPRRQVHAHRQHQRARRQGQGRSPSRDCHDHRRPASRRRSCCSTSRRCARRGEARARSAAADAKATRAPRRCVTRWRSSSREPLDRFAPRRRPPAAPTPSRPAVPAANAAAHRRAGRRTPIEPDGRRDPFLNLLGTGDEPPVASAGGRRRRRADRSPRSRCAASCRAAARSSRWFRGPTTRRIWSTRATSSLDGIVQDRHAAGARHRAGSERSAVAREAAGSAQAAAIARGREGVTVTRGLALFLAIDGRSARRCSRMPRRPMRPRLPSSAAEGHQHRASTRTARRSSSKPPSRWRTSPTRPDPLTVCSTSATSAADGVANASPGGREEPDRRRRRSKPTESLGAPVSRVRDRR